MLPIPSNLNARDLHQWVNGTCVLHEGKVGEVVEVEDTAVDPGLYLSFWNEEAGGDTGAELVPPHECVLFWPESQSVNIARKKFAVHMQRTQQRQYRRSFNNRGYRQVTPDVEAMRHPRFQNLRVGTQLRQVELAHNIMHPVYPSLEEAMRLMREGDLLSAALSKSVILTARGNIYYRGDRVAKLHDRRLVSLCSAFLPKAVCSLFGGYT